METRGELIKRINSTPAFQEISVWAIIETIDYLFTREYDCFHIIHRIDPYDMGERQYGTSVDIKLPLDYFKSHSVEDLYDTIAQEVEFRPKSFDRTDELQSLTKKLKEQKWLD